MIRPAVSADVPAIFGLIHELAVYEKLEHLMAGTAEMLGEDLFGERAMLAGFVAEVEGSVVGYALAFRNYSTFLTRPGIWLEDIYVTPSHRGSGLGKALLLQVLEFAKASGAGRLEWAVLDWNQPAIDFYEAMGATVMPDWRICRIVL